MKWLLSTAMFFLVVLAFGHAAFAKPFIVKEPPPVLGVTNAHERTVPPSFGELNSVCWYKWTNGCA